MGFGAGASRDFAGSTIVHGGTLAVGLFVEQVDWMRQQLGVAAVAALSFPTAHLLMTLLDRGLGMRVSEDEERRGLDIEEHGASASVGLGGIG